ncbi:MAG: hypothetical protein FWD24_05700 [Treponema sp.]|nr:hypothetical protein [Treponema sp.]
MCRKFAIIFLLAVLLLIVSPIFAEFQREKVFISTSIETIPYDFESFVIGGGMSFGYGTGASVGMKLAWFFGFEGMNALELNVFWKYFLPGLNADTGPFLQLMLGPVIFNRMDEFSIGSNKGSMTYGLGFGWRFLIGDLWYVEPMVRGGYPYIISAGVSGGMRL